jgi:hypothetical protein
MAEDNEPIVDLLADGVEVEGEEDLERAELKELKQTVVAASDWTAETIIGQLDRGNIDINPAFQRRDAWDPSA